MFKENKSTADLLAIGFTVLLVVIGALCLAIGYLDFGLELPDSAFEYFKKFGELVFVAGAFAAFLKTIQIMKVVKNDLAEILYSEKFISEYLDVKKLWQRLYQIIHEKLYPRLPKAISKKIIERNTPQELDYYIEDLCLNLEISWKDKEKGVVCVSTVQQQKIKLINEHGSIIKRNFFSDVSSESSYELISIRLNSEEISQNHITTRREGASLFTEFSVEIEDDCLFEQATRFYQDVKADPVYNFRITKFVDRLMVNILIRDRDLDVSFIPFGSDAWKSNSSVFPSGNMIQARFDDLYYQNQGFTLVFVPKNG